MMEHKTGLLLVEGNDDLHVFANLFREHGVPKTFRIQPYAGIDPLLESLPVRLKGSEGNRLGIVVDADLDAHHRWQQLYNILSRAGFENLPGEIPHSGLIAERDHGLRVGVWILPDNKLPGQLEDFVKLMVPSRDNLWMHAHESVLGIPENERRFKANDLIKAIIHTWLAWQEQPGVPMGGAIKRKYLRPDTPEATLFVNWIRRLFA